MSRKLIQSTFITFLIIPLSILTIQTVKAAPTSFDSITLTKFEQAAGDDLLDNKISLEIEITAAPLDFDYLRLIIFESSSTHTELYNYNTETAYRVDINKSQFINDKLSLNIEAPLLFENTNYIELLAYNFEPYGLYSYRQFTDSESELIVEKIAPQIPVYRFFNTKLGTHLYTTSAVEKDGLKDEFYSNPNAEWDYEEYKFFVFKDAIAHPDAVAVHRFFNTQEGGHIYTISETEKNTIMNNLPKYTYEGIKYYVVANPTIGFVPVYRFFNTKTGTHLYTISEAEKSTIMTTLPQYSYEGVKFHVLEN
jgi:hypothetical protein